MQLRHLIMLSLGGVIGSGLFFGTGHIIANVGAFGTVLAYLIGAFMVYPDHVELRRTFRRSP